MGHASRLAGFNPHRGTWREIQQAASQCDFYSQKVLCFFSFLPSDFHRNKGPIAPAGTFCKISLQSASTRPANTTQAQIPPGLLWSKGPPRDGLPVTQTRAKLFSGFGKRTDVLLGWRRQALPHTFSLDVLTNVSSQLFRGDQQLMHAKAGARIITHGSHAAPNSCQGAKFLPGSQRHGVHFGCPSTCSLKMISEHRELMMKWSLWMNKQEKIKQTQRNMPQDPEPERMGFA